MSIDTSKTCPRCGSSMLIKDGIVLERQRYLCKECTYHFTVAIRKQRIDQNLKREAIVMYLFGLSISKISKLTGINEPTVFKWVKELGPKFDLMRTAEKPKIIFARTNPEKVIRMADSEWALIYKDGAAELRVQAKDKIKMLERRESGGSR